MHNVKKCVLRMMSYFYDLNCRMKVCVCTASAPSRHSLKIKAKRSFGLMPSSTYRAPLVSEFYKSPWDIVGIACKQCCACV